MYNESQLQNYNYRERFRLVTYTYVQVYIIKNVFDELETIDKFLINTDFSSPIKSRMDTYELC